jgi:hypothetical protein
MTELKRGRLTIRGNQTTKGFGCHCSGPAYGTEFCLCELARMQAEQEERGDDDDDYEDRKK